MPKKRAAPTEVEITDPPQKRRSTRSESKQTASKPVPKKAPADDSKLKKSTIKKAVTATAAPKARDEREPGEIRYWLMKAEPESRSENGVDVSFSIDDLAAKTQPEPWDGIRNHRAKNNLLAMRKGDLAFFYHSNCKVPGIVGLMEVVGEAIPDVTAWNPKSPYYDSKSVPDKPRWFCSLVEFRRKFKEIVSLERLKQEAQDGAPIADMQVLKISRLSVSEVSKKEWEYIMSLVEKQ